MTNARLIWCHFHLIWREKTRKLLRLIRKLLNYYFYNSFFVSLMEYSNENSYECHTSNEITSELTYNSSINLIRYSKFKASAHKLVATQVCLEFQWVF